MRFKTPDLSAQYARINPTLRALLDDLDAFCKEQGFEEPIATHIQRTMDQQEDIYWRIVLTQGGPGMTEGQARNLARHKFTWHFVLCAVDLRDYIYPPKQMAVILDWLRRKTATKEWEFLYHDVGRGKHLHIGIRDSQWAKSIPVT